MWITNEDAGTKNFHANATNEVQGHEEKAKNTLGGL
jgi:hypothetical protein